MTITRLNKNAIFISVLLFGSAAFIYILSRQGFGSTLWKRDSDKDGKVQGRFYKINSDGRYLPFHGYTVVSMVQARMQYNNIVKYLQTSKVLSKYLAPLPVSSYHVTMFDLFTERNVPEKYQPKSKLVATKHWLDAADDLQQDLSTVQKSCYSFIGDMSFKKERFQLGKYPGDGLTVYGSVTNMDEVTRLRQDIASLFKARKPRPFHMTLAYIFRTIEDSDAQAVNEEIQHLWSMIRDEYPLEQPNLYYFETMEEFVPYTRFF